MMQRWRGASARTAHAALNAHQRHMFAGGVHQQQQRKTLCDGANEGWGGGREGKSKIIKRISGLSGWQKDPSDLSYGSGTHSGDDAGNPIRERAVSVIGAPLIYGQPLYACPSST